MLSEQSRGIAAGLLAFVIWGILVLFWRLLESLSALEILSWRIIFSSVLVLPLVLLLRRGGELKRAMASRDTLWRICCSTTLIALDWFLFIWATNNGHALATSLGYYINPLMTAALGVIFLRERAGTLQWIALVLAAAGVVWTIVMRGTLPWLALLLALTFALYGFIRKTVHVEALPGLCLESLLLTPPAIAWILWETAHGTGFLCRPSLYEGFLLVCSGFVTALPMALFAYATRRVRLITLGLMQYLSPSGTFLIAIFIFRERLVIADMVMFVCIWAALIIYTLDGWRHYCQMRR